MIVYDCAIVGAGPAGLSASLILGRSRRNIALFDDGTNRNRVTQESHGYLTRDGIKPAEFKNIALRELEKYPSVHFFKEKVTHITKQTSGSLLKMSTSGGKTYVAEKLILAMGIREKFPQVPEVNEYYGKSLFSCPYCDGWELRDQPLIIIAENESSAYHAGKLIHNWSEDLLVATNGQDISQSVKDDLERKGIIVNTEPIKKLSGNQGYLEKVAFASGSEIKRKGGFISASFYRPNQFVESLGCVIQDDGKIVTDEFGRTSQKNIYVAGEFAHLFPSSLMIAASEGHKAAVAVNTDITNERF